MTFLPEDAEDPKRAVDHYLSMSKDRIKTSYAKTRM